MDNAEQIAEMCRLAVADIIRSVGGVGNLLLDEGKMALIQAIADRLTQLGADVDAILGDQLAGAYFQGLNDADSFLRTQGVDTTVNGVNKQVHLAGVESIVADTMQDMNASFRTALMAGIANINGIVEAVNNDIAKGMILGNGSDAVARQVEQTFMQNGMTSFVTSDGKKLPLDFYAQTVVRTKMRTSHTEGAVNRYKESGVYHVKINEHHPTCQKCARYQGMVVALDKEHAQGFPTDIPLPPYHPNCQHVARPYVMDFHSKTDIANEKKKWNQFDPDDDPRTEAQKNLYKNEQDIRRKARAEMKEYDKMKATLGDKAPKTIGAFRRAKRKNDKAWKELQAEYKKNLDNVDSAGPPPGTPKKKKGSGSGAVGKAKTPPKEKKADPPENPNPLKGARAKKAITRTPEPPKPKPPAKPKAPPTPKGPKLDNADKKSIAEFDRIIDGIEFTGQKNVGNHLLSRNARTEHLSTSVRSNTGSSGHCRTGVMGGKAVVLEYVLEKKVAVSDLHKNQTIFHEYFHANMHGLPVKYKRGDGTGYDMGGDKFTAMEETATETAGIFMTNRSGQKFRGETPAYADYLIGNLPRLKELDEFKDCTTLDDFGAKFMKYRFDPEHATTDWKPLGDKLDSLGKHDKFEYANKHYTGWIRDNKELVTQKMFDALTQDNKFSNEIRYKEHLWNHVEKGVKEKKMNAIFEMAVATAMNTIGVKGMKE